MRNIVYLVLICLFLLITSKLSSQQFDPSDYRKELSIKLDVIDEKRIEKGVKLLNDAYKIERDAITQLENIAEDEKLRAVSPEYKKAVKTLIEASEKYREGHIIVYTVFQENCAKFGEIMKKKNHTAFGINKARLYERKASKAYDRSLAVRDLVAMLEKPDLVQYKMAEALELEKLAIRDRGRAVQIYQDFPVEYNYGWDNDVTPEEVAAEFKDPAISLPPDDLFVQKPITPTTADSIVASHIIFRVQIAAHTVPMDIQQIHASIYRGKEKISELHEDNWYKYTIGEFDNFNDANRLLKQSQVKKAFVVAYKGGKRLPIKDALSDIRENQIP